MLQTWTFEVVGSQRINRAGCERTIQRSLSRLAGIRQIQADHQTQRIVVLAESLQTTTEEVCARLEACGYQVQQTMTDTGKGGEDDGLETRGSLPVP
jgi:cation transport ATPase